MAAGPHVLMVFLDGVGIGAKDSPHNPFFSAPLPAFTKLGGGTLPSLRNARHSSSIASCVPVNATLGVKGLPQSGTGQTSLMTGINAARLIGKHFGPYPYSTLKPVIAESNIFRQLHDSGKSVCFANAFPRQFFEYIAAKNRASAITTSWISSGFALNDHHALAAGEALSADITNARWPSMGYPDIQPISPQKAGARLASLAREHNFVLFEYWLTDHVGHDQSAREANDVLHNLDGLFEGILDNLGGTLLVVTSDHGNLEDLSTKSHTRNPVPLMCAGRQHHRITDRVKNLTHIAPAILELF
ncbi:MAG TPA: metalloenzyme [Bacteroidota bacterium]|nr:metalloenzyme [Bacteroidota bacterium]